MSTDIAPINDNHVFMHPNGYIEVATVGTQSVESVRDMGDNIADLSRSLRANHQRVLILDNLTKMALKQPNEVPKAVAAEAKRLDYDKAAMLGSSSRLLKYTSSFLLQAIGLGEKIKYFTDRSEAEKWLFER